MALEDNEVGRVSFVKDQDVIYMRARSNAHGRKSEDIPATYVEEVQFSWKDRRHKIVIKATGKNRFVSTYALRNVDTSSEGTT